MISQERGDEFNKILTDILKEKIPDKKVALMFSSGVDSLSIAFALEEIGKEVVPYTFRIDGSESPDSIGSRKACKIMNWDFNLIELPRQNLKKDIITLAKKYNCNKKTDFECVWPWLYVIPEVKEKYITSGYGADFWFGLSRHDMMYWRYPFSTFVSSRKEIWDNISSGKSWGNYNIFKQIVDEYNKISVAPYRDESVYNYFKVLDWDQINTPVQKYPILLAFKEGFKKVGRRDHKNYQLCAGIDRLFETLLVDPEVNKKNRTRVMDLCRDIHAEYGST